MPSRGWSRDYREALVKDYRASGKEQREFCQERGISVSGLQSSLKVVNGSALERKFIELPLASSPRAKLEISFSDGTILRVL